MSRMRRNPVTPPDFLADTPKLDGESIENAEHAIKQFAESTEKANTAVKDLAKVMTADQTPLCPFCLSPKLEPISADNPWGRKWVCNACCTAFREPVTGRAA